MDSSQFTTILFNIVSPLTGFTAYGTIVGILVICGLGIPIPEDITLLAAGLLASAGNVTLLGALLAGLFGVLFGDAFLFFMGRRFGKRIFLLPGFRRIFTPELITAAEDRIRRNGPFICFIARFLPGLRSPVFAMAGALGVKPYTFLALDGFAALISVPIWVYLGFWFGSNFEEAVKRAKHVQMYIGLGVVIAVSIYITWRLIHRRRRRRANADASITPGVAEL